MLRNVTFLNTYCKLLSTYTKCKPTYKTCQQWTIDNLCSIRNRSVPASHGRFITYRRFCAYMYTSEYYDLKFVCKNDCKPRALLRPIQSYTDSPWTLHTTHMLLQLYIWTLFFLTVNLYAKILTNQTAIRTYLTPQGRFILTPRISHYI